MRRPIVAGNWKMFLTVHEAESLVKQLVRNCPLDGAEVVVCPSFTLLPAVKAVLGDSLIGLGAQDLFWETEGAFTGEVSPPMLRDAGCQFVIIGHSERRQHFGETDQTVNRKLLSAFKHGLKPIVCIGETLAEREANQTFSVLERQLSGGLNGLGVAEAERLVLAYEPVWAIGTGRNATPEQAQEAHRFIREWLSKRFGAAVSERIRLQYGGSVKAENAANLMQQPDVDGALVGGASLKPDSFMAIVKSANLADNRVAS